MTKISSKEKALRQAERRGVQSAYGIAQRAVADVGKQDIERDFADAVSGWSKPLAGAGYIDTGFAVYLMVEAILTNRGKNFQFSPAFIAVMIENCTLGGYYGATANMIRKQAAVVRRTGDGHE
jgi:hypothetical protein